MTDGQITASSLVAVDARWSFARMSWRGRELLIAVGLSGLLIGAALWYPAATPAVNLCVFHQVTGLPCPGCGMGRSLCAFAKGDVARSIAWHPLGPVVGLAALLAAMRAWLRLVLVRQRLYAIPRRVVSVLAWIGLLVLLAVWSFDPS